MTGPRIDPLADYTPDWRKSSAKPIEDDPLADYHPDWRKGVLGRAVDKFAAGLEQMVTHPIDTAMDVVAAPVRAAFNAAIAPGVGEARPDPRLSKGGNSSGRAIDRSAYDADHGAITDKQRADAGMQALVMAGAPGVGRAVTRAAAPLGAAASRAAGTIGAGAAAGAGLNPDDPMAGALAGGATTLALGAGLKAAGSVGGRALDMTGMRPTGRTAIEAAQDRATLNAPVGPEARSATPVLDAAIENATSTPTTPTIRDQVRASAGRGAKALGIEDAKTRALRQIAERWDLDNVSPSDAVAFAERAGDRPVAVLDLGAGNVAGLARTAKDTPGLGRKIIPEFLTERSSGSFGDEGQTLQRIRGDFESRLGLAPENYYASLESMTKGMKDRAASDYGKIRDVVVDDPEVLSLFDIPEWRAVHDRIRANARVAGKEAIPALRDISDVVQAADKAGTPDVLNAQKLGTLDLMKRQLDKVIQGKADAIGPVDRDMAYAMRTRLNTILDRMDELHPDYKAARTEYRGSAEAIDAYAAGKDEFLSLDPRALEARIAALPTRLQDLYRRGAYDALNTKLDAMPDGANVGDWLEKNPSIRRRVAALAKTADDATALRGDLNVERAMGARKNFILGGPNTAERLIDHANAEAEAQPTVAGDAIRTLPGGKLLGRVVDNAVTRRLKGQTSDVMGEVGKIMVRTGKSGVQLTADEIERLKADDAMRALFQPDRLGRVSSRVQAGQQGRRDR